MHAIAKGKVQGVGFRYTAVELATRLNLSGFVKNIPDGRVELLIQGEPLRIENFLNELGSRFNCEFHKEEVKDKDVYTHFRIAYSEMKE